MEKEAQEKDELQLLIDSIDKNSDGWDAVVDARDRIYRKYFAAATTDNDHEIDADALAKMLDALALHVSAYFEHESAPSLEDIRKLIEIGVFYEWEKRSKAVDENIALAQTAIMSTFTIQNNMGFTKDSTTSE